MGVVRPAAALEQLVVVSIEQYGDWTVYEEITYSGRRVVSALKVGEAEGPGGMLVYVEGTS